MTGASATVGTSLTGPEAVNLDRLAHTLGTSRAGAARAAIQYALQMESGFVLWVRSGNIS